MSEWIFPKSWGWYRVRAYRRKHAGQLHGALLRWDDDRWELFRP